MGILCIYVVCHWVYFIKSTPNILWWCPTIDVPRFSIRDFFHTPLFLPSNFEKTTYSLEMHTQTMWTFVKRMKDSICTEFSYLSYVCYKFLHVHSTPSFFQNSSVHRCLCGGALTSTLPMKSWLASNALMVHHQTTCMETRHGWCNRAQQQRQYF